jgi:hydroxymethylbilane synthase
VCDVFPSSVLLPAIGQGALALVVREGDVDAAVALAPLDDGPANREVLAERRLLRRLHAGCRAPLAARAVVSEAEGRMTLEAGVFSLDGRETVRERAEGSAQDPVALADRVASRLVARGADRILQEARS